MIEEKTIIREGGRIVIPSSLRKKLELKTGDELIVKLVKDELIVSPLKKAIHQAQSIVKKYTQGKTLTDELKSIRNEEAAHEKSCH